MWQISRSCLISDIIIRELLNDKTTYNSFPSAGPAFNTSEIAILGSPLVKCGLSLPPLTAIPKPYPGTRAKVT